MKYTTTVTDYLTWRGDIPFSVDLDGAMRRAREVAAPMNAQRFPLKTPCVANGLCGDCKGPDSICAQIVTTRLCKPAGRIKVVLVGEDLGF